MKTTLRYTWAALFAAVTPLMAGPGEPASVQRAAEAEAKTDAFRYEVTLMRTQITSSLRQLQLLQQDGKDLRVAFDKYRADMVRMDELEKLAADRAAQMKTNAAGFFQSWEQQVDSIQDKDIRQVAKERYDLRRKAYSRIVLSMDETRKALVPYLSLLKDIKKLLQIELSQESVKNAKKILTEAKWRGAAVEEELYNVIVELDRLSAEFGRYR